MSDSGCVLDAQGFTVLELDVVPSSLGGHTVDRDTHPGRLVEQWLQRVIFWETDVPDLENELGGRREGLVPFDVKFAGCVVRVEKVHGLNAC